MAMYSVYPKTFDNSNRVQSISSQCISYNLKHYTVYMYIQKFIPKEFYNMYVSKNLQHWWNHNLFIQDFWNSTFITY